MENIKKDKKPKKIPYAIETSINDVEFHKQLFKNDKKEKFYERNNTNISNMKNNFNKSNISGEKPKQEVSILNNSNFSEKQIKDFNKNIFNVDTEEEINIKKNQEILIKNSIEEMEMDYLISAEAKHKNNSNNIDLNYNNLAVISKNIDDFSPVKSEYDEKLQNYSYENNIHNSFNEKENNEQLKINSDNYRKFYLNYNHLDTPGVYEQSYQSTKNSNNFGDIKMKTEKFSPIIYKEKLSQDDLCQLNNNSLNEFSYKIMNKMIKIPKRYQNFDAKKFCPISNEEEEESRVRIWHLLQSIYNFVDESKFDPILETFKNNEILQEFFVQRIFELIANIFDSEKEIYIQKLLLEKSQFNKNINEMQKNYRELNEKLNKLEENLKISKLKDEENSKLHNIREEELVMSLNSREEKIRHLLMQLDFQEKEFHDLCKKFSDLNTDFESFKVSYDRLLNENSLLKSKLKFMDDENQSVSKRFSEVNLINKKFEEENATLTKQLNQFREDYEEVKGENEKNKVGASREIEENFSLKIKLDDRVKMLEELMSKYQNLKDISEEKNFKKENEIEMLNKKIFIMEENIKNTFKVKNSALKSKLKEKVELLEKTNLENENYKNEREKFITKMINNHQIILEEKNRIIDELLKKK